MGSSEAEENLLDDTRCARNKDTEKKNDSRAMLSVLRSRKQVVWCAAVLLRDSLVCSTMSEEARI